MRDTEKTTRGWWGRQEALDSPRKTLGRVRKRQGEVEKTLVEL
jgi:hypothetical protein